MNRSHAVIALAVAGASVLGAAPVAAAAEPAQRAAAHPTCSLRLVTTKAVNLQHDVEGTDEVRAQLGNTITRSRPYVLGQRRNTLGDGTETFTGTTQLTLQVEVLGGAWLTIDRRTIQCEDRTRDVVVSNGDARYKARAVIDVLS